jgi:hypothetical protein
MNDSDAMFLQPRIAPFVPLRTISKSMTLPSISIASRAFAQ